MERNCQLFRVYRNFFFNTFPQSIASCLCEHHKRSRNNTVIITVILGPGEVFQNNPYAPMLCGAEGCPNLHGAKPWSGSPRSSLLGVNFRTTRIH